MSFAKYTIISGTDKTGAYKSLMPNGHWDVDKALKAARRSKILGTVTVTHNVIDTNGKGRGGHDGRWQGDEAGMIRLEKWREGGKVAK